MSLRHTWIALLLLSCSGRDQPDPKGGAETVAVPAVTAPAGAETPDQAAVALDVERLDGARWIVDDAVIAGISAEAALGELTVAVRDGGHFLVKVPSASWFGALDLRPGDQIESLGAAGAPSAASLRAAVAELAERHEIAVSIRRGGHSMRRRYVVASSRLAQGIHGHRPRLTDEMSAIAAAVQPGVREAGEATYDVDRAVLAALRPTMISDSVGGYQLDATPVSAALGLTPYDQIRMVGDRDATHAGELIEQLRAQASQPEIAVVVVRLDEPVTLRYRLRTGLVDSTALAAAVEAWDRAEKARDALVAQVAGEQDKPAAGSSTSPDLAGLARRLSDTSFEVDVVRLRAVLADSGMLGHARVVPSMKAGKPNGFKLYAIRPTSVFGALGLNNGDTIEAVDGRAMTSPESALRAYADMRRLLDSDKTRTVELSIIRRGKPVVLTYRIAKR